jgi:hypothetical protein
MVIKLTQIKSAGTTSYGNLHIPNSVIIVPDVTNYTVIDPGNADNVAWYRIAVPVEANLSIVVSGNPTAVNTMIGLYDSRGILLEVAKNTAFPTPANTSLSRSMQSGIYYFAIGRVSGLTPVTYSGAFQVQAPVSVGTGIRFSLELALPPASMALGYEVTI